MQYNLNRLLQSYKGENIKFSVTGEIQYATVEQYFITYMYQLYTLNNALPDPRIITNDDTSLGPRINAAYLNPQCNIKG